MTRELERAEYDRRWSDPEDKYGAGTPGYSEHFIRFISQWLPKCAPERPRVIDVGCGDGYFSHQLARLGAQVTGMDLSPAGLAKARSRTPEGTFLEHDLSQPFPVPDGSFDAAWCSEVLEHLFAPLKTLEHIARVVRPGGLVLLTVPYHDRLKNVAIALFEFERHYDPTYPHIQYFTRKSLATIVERAGLRVQWTGKCGSNLGLRDLVFPTNLLMVAQRPGA